MSRLLCNPSSLGVLSRVVRVTGMLLSLTGGCPTSRGLPSQLCNVLCTLAAFATLVPKINDIFLYRLRPGQVVNMSRYAVVPVHSVYRLRMLTNSHTARKQLLAISTRPSPLRSRSREPSRPHLRPTVDDIRDRLRDDALRLHRRMQLVKPTKHMVSTLWNGVTFGWAHAYQRKLSWSVPVASVQTPGSPALSFNSKTHACTAPVTFTGAVPFRYTWGRENMSAKRECESNRPGGTQWFCGECARTRISLFRRCPYQCARRAGLARGPAA